MDQSVIDAIAKWPNVPACTGWLLLDRRGQWRMRDDACQAAGALGDPIRHVALKAFIERNYGKDEAGRWFFQNGPQRVFVDLVYTPLVLRLHAPSATFNSESTTASPAASITVPTLTDQCARPFDAQAAWIDDAGNVLFSDALPDTSGERKPSDIPGNSKASGMFGKTGMFNATGTDTSGTSCKTGTTGTTDTSDTFGTSATSAVKIALLHDHDLALFSEIASLNDEQAAALSDEQVEMPASISWQQIGTIHWSSEKTLPLLRIRAADVARQFAYAPRPVL